MACAIHHALQQSELFKKCIPEQVACQTKRFERNCRIPARLDIEPAIGMVVRGRVQVYSISPDGTAVNLSALEVGECFGISNIFSGEDLNTVLMSDLATTVAYISRSCFISLLEQTPEMMIGYATLCNRKLKFLTEKIELLIIPSCRGRLSAFLLSNNDGGSVMLQVSKEQWARMLGVSRASLFRELRYLSKAGYINVRKNLIMITNELALRRVLELAS